ncbi:MAG: hypothetical protein H7325_01695 [Pedobacter sp.]|nr:hypothetical protein [Pedobacter sp.]
MKFRDQKAFDSILNLLVKPENHTLKLKELANFKSYGETFLEVEKEYANVNDSKSFEEFKIKYGDMVQIKADSSLTYKFGTPLSSLFTNEKGEVKIGDFMTVYTSDRRMISYSGVHKDKSQIMSIKKLIRFKDYLSQIFNKVSLRLQPLY